MSKYEEHIVKILLKENIEFEREKSFFDLRHGRYRFDFYIPNALSKPIIIECDGEFHFSSVRTNTKLTKKNSLQAYQERDRRKNSYCLSHNIPLYRIPYWEIKNINTFEDMLDKKFLVDSMWHQDIIWDKHIRGY